MTTWVSIDGHVTPGAEARISVFDRGFLYGDSVYEVLRTIRRRPLFWGDHVERLRRSAALLHIHLDFTDDALRGELDATLARVAEGESYLRVIITRGTGSISLDPATAGSPTRVIIAQPLALPPRDLLEQGCALAVVPTGRCDEGGLDPRAKTGNRLLAVLAAARAHQVGAYEALHVDPLGRVLEGATSTFFLVRDGALLTPPLAVGILEGITRRKILELARDLGLDVQETSIHLGELAAAQEAFITSSTRGIVPVRRVDDRVFGPPGPVTRRLMAAYDALVHRAVI